MQIFTQGIKAQTRMLLSTSVGGTMKTKSNVEVKKRSWKHGTEWVREPKWPGFIEERNLGDRHS